MSPQQSTGVQPPAPNYHCPKCCAALRLTLRTSWGAYYTCGPCDWQMYWTAPAPARTVMAPTTAN